MIAIDTNVILRLIVGDDPQQLAVARALIASERVLVPLTATLECEWVLRSFYKYPPGAIAGAIDAMMVLDNIEFEHADGVRWALERLVAGADFADMVHMVQGKAAHATIFATFDGGVEGEAGGLTPLPVHTLA